MTEAATANAPPDATLSTCDQERIHELGRVQSFGGLLGISPDWIVTHQSENLCDMLGIAPADLVGESLDELLLPEALSRLRQSIRALELPGAVERIFNLSLVPDRGPFDVAMHLSQRTIILEIEPHATPDGDDVVVQMRPVIDQARAADTVDECATLATSWVRHLTKFDRVMVYRFLEDGSGEVISEARAADLSPYLGLRFPASDIPRQARALYVRNPFRIISDIDDPGHPVHPARSPEGEALDLSLASTRAVSPIHLEYLRNMGVRASLSISLIKDGALWGLIACHHRTPRTLPYSVRSAAELFGQIMSFAIEQKEAELDAAEQVLAQGLHDRIMARVAESKRLDQSFPEIVDALGEVVQHDGAIGWIDGVFKRCGETPTEEEFIPLLRMLNAAAPSTVFATDDLSAICPKAADFTERAAGLLALPVSRKPRDYIVLFRREVAKSVTWAGKPEKLVEHGPNGVRLTPRKSFDAWRELVCGKSAAWKPGELRMAEAIRVTLLEVLLRTTEESVRERAVMQQRQELLIAELNHRVRNILGLIGNLVRQSAETAGEVTEFTAIVGGRIAALSRAHDQINRQDWDGASLCELIDTEATAYLQDGADRVRLSGPDAILRPQAFSTMALVLHELITNAAKYGGLCGRRGGVDIRSEHLADGSLVVEWREWGGPPVKPPLREGFGTMIVDRSIPFELSGEAQVDYDVAGLRARFRVPAPQVLEFLEQSRPAPKPQDRPALGAVSGSVLVVEDMLLLAMGTERHLKRLGVGEVVIAASCDDAIAAIGKTRFAFAILDVHLDHETSAPVAKALSDAGIPFIVATGYGDAKLGIEEFGGAPVISKPFDVEDIAEAVNRL